MASLTTGGLDIQSSMPTYGSGSYTLNKFQFCKVYGTGWQDSMGRYTFSGTNIMIPLVGCGSPGNMGSTFYVEGSGSSTTGYAAVMRIY